MTQPDLFGPIPQPRKSKREDAAEAMELACTRMHREAVFRYFCGICWKKIKGETWQ